GVGPFAELAAAHRCYLLKCPRQVHSQSHPRSCYRIIWIRIEITIGGPRVPSGGEHGDSLSIRLLKQILLAADLARGKVRFASTITGADHRRQIRGDRIVHGIHNPAVVWVAD